MYYIKQQDDLSMMYYCKNCNSEKQLNTSITVNNNDNNDNDDNAITTQNKSHKILSNNFEIGNSTYKQYLNDNIIYDHTIPHVNNIVCKNTNCTKKDEEDNDVMYIKYDKTNIRYLYYCVHCHHFWIN